MPKKTTIYTYRRKSESEYNKDIETWKQGGKIGKQPSTLKKKYLTDSDVKKYIMSVNNWNASQYQKQYDIFKNKLRAYESYKQAQGAKVTKQSVTEVLYKEARAMQLYGPSYKPSQKMQQIKGFSAYSITKGRQLAKQVRYQERQSKKYGAYIKTRFGEYDPKDKTKNTGLIGANEGARNIIKAFEEDAVKKGQPINYAKMEDALTDYANKIGSKINDNDEVTTPNNLPNGEVYGSDEQIDFDIDAYL